MAKDNDYNCPFHRDHSKKLLDLCKAAASTGTSVATIQNELESINLTIFGEGDAISLKSRILRAEDDLKGLKELVLDNRDYVKDGFEKLESSLDKKLEGMKDIEARMKTVEADSWLPHMLNVSIHKAVIAIIGMIVLMAATNMGVWAVSKSFLFKETPNQQQQIEALLRKYIVEKDTRQPTPSPQLPEHHYPLHEGGQ